MLFFISIVIRILLQVQVCLKFRLIYGQIPSQWIGQLGRKDPFLGRGNIGNDDFDQVAFPGKIIPASHPQQIKPSLAFESKFTGPFFKDGVFEGNRIIGKGKCWYFSPFPDLVDE
jgi:hypothetical protein